MEVHFLGIPAPLGNIIHCNTPVRMPCGGIHAMLGLPAVPLNMAFWVGVAQAGLYIYVKRRRGGIGYQ